jgi:hypothetical protein
MGHQKGIIITGATASFKDTKIVAKEAFRGSCIRGRGAYFFSRQRIAQRAVKGRQQLEFPVGRSFRDITDWVDQQPANFAGRHVGCLCFYAKRETMTSAGDICIVDLAGPRRTLPKG